MTPSPIEHLTPDELEAIGAELDTIRDEVIADVGEQDARPLCTSGRGIVGGIRAG
jgi:NADPH-dependent stearoyl-CoA 9-desaturase